MTEQVYDDEKEPDLDSLSPSEIGDLEEKYSSRQDEAEDQDIDQGGDAKKLPNKGMGRKLRERSEKADSDKEEQLNNSLREEWKKAKEGDKAAGKSLYNPVAQGPGSFIEKLRQRRRLLIGVGVASTLIIGIVVALFGILNVFKLDDIMSNIDTKSFARFNAATDRRSDKWIQSYLTLRLTQLKGDGADPDSEYFRANKVDTNNPIRDWYRTMRTSNFETDLAKQGIAFVNKPAGNGFTFSVLEVDGTQIAGMTAADVRSGNLTTQLKANSTLVQNILDEVDLTKPGGNAEARQKLKKVIDEVSQDQSVIKRRQVRKDIQNMTGVRDWRFFETTRDKVDTTKINIRNKLITAAIPKDTLAGKFVRCLFGITSCQFSEDPSNPQYQSEAGVVGAEDPDNPGDTIQETDTSGKAKPPEVVDLEPAATALSEIIKNSLGVVSAVNVVSLLDSLSKVNTAIQNGDISKMVAVARGVQAMGLYQVFETSRDQLKSGQVTSDEVNQFMQVIGPVASSEGWTKVVGGQGDPTKLTDNTASQQYCSTQHQAELDKNIDEANKEFAYLCPDKQIGGASNASTLESAYNKTIGPVLGPILKAYNKARNVPVIGGILDFGEKLLGDISGVFSSALSSLFNVLGFGKDINAAIQWVFGKVASFLGAGPILTGNESGGQFMNWLVQGGAYTAEATARANGASLTTPQSAMASETALNSYDKSQLAQESLVSRYFSPSDPDSPAAKTLFAASEFNFSKIGNSALNFGSMLKIVGSAVTLPFSHRALAATDNGYSASDFAGIQTYDYPAQCYGLAPLTEQPQDGTNAQQVFAKIGVQIPTSDLTWELVTNSLDWYNYIYGKIPKTTTNPDTIVEQIYNCNLLDNAVRGGLGYVYGYTADNGLN